MKRFFRVLRTLAAFPFFMPVLIGAAAIFVIESTISRTFLLASGYWHPVSDILDKYWLEPLANWADYGVIKCS